MSAKGIASVLAALGAGMSGYAKGREIHAGNERRKVLDAREDAQYERDQGKQQKADQLETDVAASQADLSPEAIPSYDITRMDGGNPDTQPTVGYRAGGQNFVDQGAAQMALLGANSRSAKATRAADVYAKAGKLEEAAKFQKLAEQHVSEGTDQALARIQAQAPALADLDKSGGKVLGKVGDEIAGLYNNIGGRFKVSADTAVEYFKDKDPAGQPFVNARVLGKDGKPVVDDVNGAARMLMSVKERMAAQNDDSRLQLTAAQQAEQARHNGASERLDEKRTNASIADSAAQRSIQQQRLDLERKSFKKQGLSGQIADIEEATGVKLSVEDKKALAGIKVGKTKDADAVGAKIVESAVKTFQENTPNATTGQIATFRANLERDMATAKSNLQVESALQADFAGKQPDSPGYAKAWQEARGLGLSDKDLAARGYAPPKNTTPATPEQQAIAGGARVPAARIPAPPVERMWVGNSHVVNPAYVEWDKQYGEQYRQRNASSNQRLIGAYERAKL